MTRMYQWQDIIWPQSSKGQHNCHYSDVTCVLWCPKSLFSTICVGNVLITGGFHSQRASNVEAVTVSVGRFNIKMISYLYKKSHCVDKTISWLSYLHNGIFYTGKMTSLYWIRAMVSSCACFMGYNIPPDFTRTNIWQQLSLTWSQVVWVNSLRLRQNGRHFADDIFKCLFLN